MHWQEIPGGVIAPLFMGSMGTRRAPRLYNRNTELGPIGTVRYSFIREPLNNDDSTVALYINGEASAEIDETYTTPPLPEEIADLETAVLVAGITPSPNLHVACIARRAYLSWTASAEADTVAYKVYQDGALIHTSDSVQAFPYEFQPGVTGGRLSVVGNYRGDTINAEWTITLASKADKEFTYNTGSGVVTKTFEYGREVTIPGGLRIIFEDSAADYADSDSWTFRIGPVTSFTTQELTPATYAFTVSAIDSAGNESTQSASGSVTIGTPIDPPADFVAAYDGSTLTFTFTPDANGDSVNIYSNIDPGNGDAIGLYVNELKPLVSGASSPLTYSSSGLDGILYFYARTVTGGVEEDNVQLYTLTVGTSAAPVDLESVTNLSGVAGPLGVAIISWEYYPGQTDATEFRVYEFSSVPDLATINAASPLTTVSYTGANSYSHTTAAIAGTRYYVVRAANANGDDQSVDYVTVTPDSTPPSTPTITATGVC